MATSASNGRRLNSAAEDDYFPSFLTATPSAPSSKSDTKENSPLNMNRSSAGDAAWPSKGKPRLTFAESLSMEKKSKGDVLLEDSPFNLVPGASDSYLDSLHVRRRKPQSALAADDADDDMDDDVPPPPTSSLSTPGGFLSDYNDISSDAPNSAPSTTAASPASAAASYFPHLHGDAWGADQQFWVTVFGFSANARAFVLQHFQTLGDVVDYTVGTGNWLHMRYATRLHAEQALRCDGQLLAGTVMIGVKKCLVSDLVGVKRDVPTSTLFGSKTRQRNPGASDLEVDPSETDIMLPPRRHQDICSRVLSYLFKW